MGSPHTITHDHTISVWFYDTNLSCGYVYVWVCEGEKGGEGGEVSGQGSCHRHVRAKTARLYRQAGSRTPQRERAEQTHACKHTNSRSSPPPRRLSVAFLSLPLAVSQIPDDVLTGGLSDWRWGCVMTDQGLYQWPAHCQLAVWRLTGRLKPKTAAVPAWLPASLHIFFLFFFSSF